MKETQGTALFLDSPQISDVLLSAVCWP